MQKVKQLSFEDISGKIDIDNFCIAAKNGISILDLPFIESKQQGKLIESEKKERY